jgi:hypothetical protein
VHYQSKSDFAGRAKNDRHAALRAAKTLARVASVRNSQGARLVANVERLIPLLEQSREVRGTPYVSTQQPLGDVASALWHFRRGNYRSLLHVSLLLAPGGPIAGLARSNGWTDRYEALAADFGECFGALNRIRYASSEQTVELGDHVVVRGPFSKRAGRVAYLPGVSAPRDVIDFGGLFRVGIVFPDGKFSIVHVDPASLDLRKIVAFVKRDASNLPGVPSDRELEA